MTRYSVPFTTYANTSITVDVPAGSTQEEIVAAAEQKLFESAPSLCHQCTGGYHGQPELELGDDWEVPEYNGAYEITNLGEEQQ